MCILARIKRICCRHRNKHRYVISSNTNNNDVIYDNVKFDLNKSYNNIHTYTYDYTESPKKIISWNVNEILCYSTPNSREKITEHLKHFNCDIICLQGLYNDYSRKYIINELKHLYQYYISGDLYKNYLLLEHSGLFIISKFPITFHKFIPYDTEFPDNLVNKGILYVTINNINMVLTDSPYYNDKYYEKYLNTITIKCPFKEYIIVGTLQHTTAHDVFNIECNNKMYTNRNKEISDYILSLYSSLKLNINIRHIDINHISHNYPLIATIENNYMSYV